MGDTEDNAPVFNNDLNVNGQAKETPMEVQETVIETDIKSDTDSGGEMLINLFDEVDITDPAKNELCPGDGSTTNGNGNKTETDAIQDDIRSDTDSCKGFGLFDVSSDEESSDEDTDSFNDIYDYSDKQQGYGNCASATNLETKSKVENSLKMEKGVKTKSEADMEDVLQMYSEVGLKDDLQVVDGAKYQMVVEKNTESKTEDDDEALEDRCCICLDEHTDPKVLHKCSHKFCTECIDAHFKIKPVCPVCFVAYGVITGNMPKGHMSDSVSKKIHLPGYERHDTIIIHYSFGDGTQTQDHPNPGMAYYGTSRTAYLPDNAEGQKVLRLLKAAFDRRLTFTVGRSRTTGCDNVVTWNDVHHKTSPQGGQENFGYPDPTYLQRVQEELASLGVTEESLREFPS